MVNASEDSPVARALGRIPTGLYIVTSKHADGSLGFVGSFVMQVGFDPPTVCVAVGQKRAQLDAIQASGRFALSILDADSSRLMGAFFKKYPEGESALDHVETKDSPGGLPILSEALAWLDCQVTGLHKTGDHVVFFGTVEHGEALREGDPSVHLRKNGFSY